MDRSWLGIFIFSLALSAGCSEGSSDDPFALTAGSPASGVGGDLDEDTGEADDGDPADDGGDSPADADDGAETGAQGDDGGDDAGDDGGNAEPPPPSGLCHEAAPAGSPEPPSPKSYSGGSCPEIAPGYNTGFQSDGRAREFMLVVPSDHDPGKSYPLVFAWYHITGNAMDFVDYIDVQVLADEKQMIFVIPQDSGMFQATWPMTPLDNDQASVDLVFFDDLLSCLHAQFSVNLHCVASAGVSSGALWTAFLGQRRGEHLASNLVFSGGYPTEFGAYWWNWQESPHRFASLVLWGGPTDELGINFHNASLNYIDHLKGDGHFLLRCEHDQGHGAPPPDEGQDAPPIDAMFDFVLQHPYWYQGSSIYQTEGPPDDMPSYCQMP